MKSRRARRALALAATAAVAVSAALVSGQATAAPIPPLALSANAITQVLNQQVSIPGTTWGTQAEDHVVVTYDDTVDTTELAALTSVTRQFGRRVSLERMPGTLAPTLNGGSGIYANGAHCSLGFNVRKNSTYYFIAAGHCADQGITSWYDSSAKTTLAATTLHTGFPVVDYAIMQYSATYTNRPGNVNAGNGIAQEISSAGSAYVGQAIKRSGLTTGVRSGTVTAINVTTNVRGYQFTGMIRTNACAESGDSGGPLYAGTIALGILSSASGNCSSGGTSHYQPIVEALNRYNVSIY